MTKEEYHALLETDYWKGYSYSIIKERNFTCEDCGRAFPNERNKLQVHHLVYRDVNPWSYKPEELVVLCRECHEKRHGIIPKDTLKPERIDGADWKVKLVNFFSKMWACLKKAMGKKALKKVILLLAFFVIYLTVKTYQDNMSLQQTHTTQKSKPAKASKKHKKQKKKKKSKRNKIPAENKNNEIDEFVVVEDENVSSIENISNDPTPEIQP